MVWDQASAAMARGEIQLHLRDGHPLPPGTGIDRDGNPSTDPEAVLAGAQLPFGGYKGSAIALMVDLLAGPLMDEVTSLEAGHSATGGGPVLGGELILALDPARFGSGKAGLARAERLFADLTGEPGVRLPGDRRLANRARIARQGAAVPAALHSELVALAGA